MRDCRKIKDFLQESIRADDPRDYDLIVNTTCIDAEPAVRLAENRATAELEALMSQVGAVNNP